MATCLRRLGEVDEALASASALSTSPRPWRTATCRSPHAITWAKSIFGPSTTIDGRRRYAEKTVEASTASRSGSAWDCSFPLRILPCDLGVVPRGARWHLPRRECTGRTPSGWPRWSSILQSGLGSVFAVGHLSLRQGPCPWPYTVRIRTWAGRSASAQPHRFVTCIRLGQGSLARERWPTRDTRPGQTVGMLDHLGQPEGVLPCTRASANAPSSARHHTKIARGIRRGKLQSQSAPGAGRRGGPHGFFCIPPRPSIVVEGQK